MFVRCMTSDQGLCADGRKKEDSEQKKRTAQSLQLGCKALKDAWEKSLKDTEQKLPENDWKEYRKGFCMQQHTPKFQMIEHLVKKAMKEDASILIFVGAVSYFACGETAMSWQFPMS